MKKMKTVLFVIGMLCMLSLKAQTEETEKALIQEKIDLYFEGWMTGDTTKIGKAMHATCKLKNIKDGKVIVYDRATYLGFFKPRSRRKDSSGRLVTLDITGSIAAAKCEIDTPKFLATDYFNLMKVEGEWFIVDKIATSVEKE